MNSPTPSLSSCRACKGADLVEALSLGNLAISDFTAGKPKDLPTAPLTLLLCQGCGLVQLSHMVSREHLYTHYHYRSGTQESMVRALREVVEETLEAYPHKDGYWIDIGANDGTLLKMVPEQFGKLAYEPATNLWWPLQISGARIVGRYFPNTLQRAGVVGIDPPAKIITSIACFYSCDDPDLFVAAIKKCLAEDGVWVNQMSYWPQTMASNNFGDVCHEHLTYWSLHAFQALIDRHGMKIDKIDFNDVNGGSIRTYVTHTTGRASNYGLHDKPTIIQMKRFRQRIELHRTEIRDLLHRLKRDGKKVIGYGASTKGNTYLQYWDIGTDLMEEIAERNEEKIGRYVPTGQVIVDEEKMRTGGYDYALVLPWHFIDSFVAREAEFLAKGGQFIVPMPQVYTVSADDGVLKATTPTAAG